MAFCDQCGDRLGPLDQPPAHVACRPVAGPLVPSPASAPQATASSAMATRPLGMVPWRVRWDGRPKQWPQAWRWLTFGAARNWRGVTVSLLCAWFQVPLVVIMGAFGAILGGIAGAVSGTAFGDGIIARMDILTSYVVPLPLEGGISDLLPTAAWQIGLGIGALWGAISGAINLGWMALYWPWALLYEGDTSWPIQVFIGQIVVGLLVGVAYTVWSITTEASRLRLGGARRLSRREEAWLMPIVEDIGARMRLHGIPIIRVTDSRDVNAFAATRHIVIHRGLLLHLAYDRAAVEGVIAHELGHWRNADSVSHTFVKGCGLPLYIMYEIAYRLVQASERVRPLQWILRVLLWGVTTTVRFLVMPVQAQSWRTAELRADQAAAAAGAGEGLRKALSSFSESFDGGLDGWDEVMLRSHPSNELRMEALEDVDRSYPLVTGSGGAASAAGTGRKTSTVEKGW